MKYLAVVLGTVFTLGMVGFIYSRRNTEFQLTKTSYFDNVKHRVTSDVLKELQSNIAEAKTRQDQNKKQVEDLTTQIKAAQEAADGKKAELNTCKDELIQIKAEIVALKAETNKAEAEFEQKKASLKEQKNNLKLQAEGRSSMCDYIIKTSVEGMKLCGIVPVLHAAQNPAA